MKKSQDRKHIYFIGIGGIGMSALAQYYLSEGWRVSGSDVASSDITEMLEKMGVKIFNQSLISKFQKQRKNKIKKYVEKSDRVIYSAAVPGSDWQLKYAKKMGIKILSYAEALGELTRKYKTICVSGTHGKSTTTAMLALIMIKAKLDPTVILGTKLKEFNMCGVGPRTYGSNFRKGRSEWLLIEADEFNASFLNYSPQMIVLTNIEADHLDYYKDLNDIIRTFKKYASSLADDGILIVNKDDKNIQGMLNLKFEIQNYSIDNKKDVEKLKKILQVSGEYNIYNALAALAVARALKISDKISFKALGEFKGAWRRMETVGKYKGIKIISDYAHHPTEIKAVLGAISNFPPTPRLWRTGKFSVDAKALAGRQISNLIVVFQPHQQHRTEKLFDDFVKVFGKADPKFKIIITDIYEVAGREIKHKNKDAKCLVDSVNKKYSKVNVIYIPKKKLESYIRDNISNFKFQISNSLVFMGAGNIDALARELVTSD